MAGWEILPLIFLERGRLVQMNKGGRGKSGGCCCSFAKSCPNLCDPMDCSTVGFPVLHYLPKFVQNHVPRVSDPIQPSHPLSPPSPPAFDLSQHQGLFKLKLLSPLEVTTPHFGAAAPALCNGPHSVCGVCLSLNKSASYLSLCLSLNSFCNKTSRT